MTNICSMKLGWIGLILIGFATIGCATPSGPPSTSSTHHGVGNLDDRIAFVERYVAFRRTYLDLEYSIVFQNNGGFVPAPSDWDVKLIATVPPESIDDWLPGAAAKIPAGDWAWHEETADQIDVQNIQQWYTVGSRVTIGVNREQGIVAYRNSSNGNY